MSERMKDERIQHLTVHGFGALTLDDMLGFLKAERKEVKRLRGERDYWKSTVETARSTNGVDVLARRLTRLLERYAEAIENIEDWAAYASDYFQQKHDLAGCLKQHRAALAEIQERPVEEKDDE